MRLEQQGLVIGTIIGIIFISLVAVGVAAAIKTKDSVQARIWQGSEECRSKGGHILPDRSRSNTTYRCLGPKGLIAISVDMRTGFGGIKYR